MRNGSGSLQGYATAGQFLAQMRDKLERQEVLFG